VRRAAVHRCTQNLSDATIARRLAAVSSFFDFTRANSSKKVQNPIDDFSNRWKRNNRPKPVERHVIDKLLITIDSPRDQVLMQLFLATGLRISEMAQLDRTSIRIEELTEDGKPMVLGIGEVVGKGKKSRNFYVSQKMLLPYIRYLRERKDEHPALFLSERNKRMSVRAMQERLAYWCRKAGIPHTRVHRLRHTFATGWQMQGWTSCSSKNLRANVEITETVNISYYVDTSALPADVGPRAANHFRILQLDLLYSVCAARELVSKRADFVRTFGGGDSMALQADLLSEFESRRIPTANSWQPVLYRELAANPEFYEGGFF
jgi:site-specific recombinase XerC